MNYTTLRNAAHTFHKDLHFTSLHFTTLINTSCHTPFNLPSPHFISFLLIFTTPLFHTLHLLYHSSKPLPKITWFTDEFIALRTDTHISQDLHVTPLHHTFQPFTSYPVQPPSPFTLPHLMIIFTTLLFSSLNCMYHFPNPLPKITWFAGEIPCSICR
jgi:hypothetical protein